MVIVSFKPKIPEYYIALCSASKSKSNKQDPRDRTLDLPFFFRSKDITSHKNRLLLEQVENLPYWFLETFAAMFVLIYRLREFLLSAVANRFELR